MRFSDHSELLRTYAQKEKEVPSLTDKCLPLQLFTLLYHLRSYVQKYTLEIYQKSFESFLFVSRRNYNPEEGLCWKLKHRAKFLLIYFSYSSHFVCFSLPPPLGSVDYQSAVYILHLKQLLIKVRSTRDPAFIGFSCRF